MKITRCRISKKAQCRLLEFFVLEVTARSAANILGFQTNSAALFYRKIRQVITFHLAQEAIEVFNGEVVIDGSYLGGVRENKCDRGAAGKVVVFGMLKRHGKVFTVIEENTKSNAPLNEIARKIRPDSIIYSDAYHSYDTLEVSKFHHQRISHSDVFVDERNHINGIENF